MHGVTFQDTVRFLKIMFYYVDTMLAIPTSILSTFFSLKRVCQTLKTILFYGRDILNVDSSLHAAL